MSDDQAARPRAATHEPSTDPLSAFEGAVPRVKTSLLYRLGLLVVAVAMVLLPLVYVGLIGLAGYGMYWHATVNRRVLEEHASVGALALYVAPLVIGSIFVFFMLKPLVARPPKGPRPRSVDPTEEPLLFAFVAELCRSVGAPPPRRIDVDCEVNGSASFRRGLLSLFGRDLVLTIGLPLAAGLTVRQLAGVLAHEFGHFSQGAGMRLTYVIRSINLWFARIVYERDRWDVSLRQTAEESDFRIALMLYLVMFFVWLTRKVLWVLMNIGHAISCFALRQMEFDADRYEARLAGSSTFEATALQLELLGTAAHGARMHLAHAWQEQRLADNLPALIVGNIEQIPAEARDKILEDAREQKTGLFDTHPSTGQRVAMARAEQAEGVFRAQGPASAPFHNFEDFCRQVTLEYYRAEVSPEIAAGNLVPYGSLLQQQRALEESSEAASRFFQGTLSSLRPLFLDRDSIGAPADEEDAIRRVRLGRQRVESGASDFRRAHAKYDEADTQLIGAEQALALLEAGFQIEPEPFGLREGSQDAARAARSEAKAQQEAAAATLDAFAEAMRERLAACLELLYVPAVASRLKEDDRGCARVAALVSALAALAKAFGPLLELRRDFAALSILVSQIEGKEMAEAHYDTTMKRAERVRGRLVQIYDALSSTDYPFDHAKGNVAIAEYALEKVPDVDDLNGVCSASDGAQDKLFGLHWKLMSQLAVAAEKVEAALDLDPMKAPEEDERDE